MKPLDTFQSLAQSRSDLDRVYEPDPLAWPSVIRNVVQDTRLRQLLRADDVRKSPQVNVAVLVAHAVLPTHKGIHIDVNNFSHAGLPTALR